MNFQGKEQLCGSLNITSITSEAYNITCDRGRCGDQVFLKQSEGDGSMYSDPGRHCIHILEVEIYWTINGNFNIKIDFKFGNYYII